MAVLKAVKGNKEVKIVASETKRYQALGFDILEGDKVVQFGAGKTVPYGQYQQVLDELQALKAAQAKKAVK